MSVNLSGKEQDLIAQARAGNAVACGELYSDIRPQITSYLYRLMADRQDAEDLAQDTYLKAVDGIAAFRGDSSFKTWTFSIATRLAIDTLRRRKRWPTDSMDQCRSASMASPKIQARYHQITQESPQGAFEIREHIDFCFTCIAKTLTVTRQLVLILKDIYQFKTREVAEITGQSEAVVKHALRDARATMMDIFDDRCALVNKNGACHQCSELNGMLNPKQTAQEQLVKLEMVQESSSSSRSLLLELRAKLVRAIDPVNANGTDLHDFQMQHLREIIGEINPA